MSEQDINDLMDDGDPKPEPESDTKTSPKGEEIPSDITPPPEFKEDEILEKDEPSKTDEPAEQVPEGTEDKVELSETEKRFIELGLDKQFKGGLSEAIQRLPDMNKYITALENERNALRSQTATPT